MACSWKKMSWVCYDVTYCHIPFTLKQVNESEAVFHSTNTMYMWISSVLGLLLLLTVQARCHIHTIYIPLDLLILIYKYLVKPWLKSTVFKPTLQLFKHKTLEYSKILNSKNCLFFLWSKTLLPKGKNCFKYFFHIISLQISFLNVQYFNTVIL